MKKLLKNTATVLLVSALPLAGIAAAGLMASADVAYAKGKSDDKGGGKDKSKDRGNDKDRGKPDNAGKSNSANELKGLNSLRRNINGLMNSSDPKMAGFRDYLLANEALANAQDALAALQDGYATASADYDALQLSGDPAFDLQALQSALDGLEAPGADATQDQIDAYNAQVAQISSAISTVETFIDESADYDAAVQAVADATAGTTEEDKLQAFVQAMHASGQTDFTVDDITDEMLALFQSHIDDYLN